MYRRYNNSLQCKKYFYRKYISFLKNFHTEKKTFAEVSKVQRVRFVRPLKLLSDLYLAEFLDTSAKSFFPCEHKKLYYLNAQKVFVQSRNLTSSIRNIFIVSFIMY